MSGFKLFDRHGKLVERMASTVSVDLDEAVQRAEVSGEQLRDAVYRCMGCSKVDDCEHWVAAHSEGADETPGYCRNSEFFRKIAET